MMRNSIRQMLRTPVKMILFLVLMLVSSLLVTMGGNLFYSSMKTQDAAEGTFRTIGTVEQKPSSTSKRKYWDVYTQSYAYYSNKIYDAPISDTVLDVKGISYIHKPVHQPWYIAHKEGYVVRNTRNEVDESWMGLGANSVIAEVTPFEDCVPDHPVQMHFKKTLYGKITERMLNKIWFWDYTRPDPEPLYAGKTYIMAIFNNVTLEYSGIVDKEKYPDVTAVWAPWVDIQGSQYAKDGTEVEDSAYKDRYWSEITDGFYETAEGKRWLNLMEGFDAANYSIPVSATDDTNLLMRFYNGDAGIAEGRDITQEEYASGKKVCLVSKEFGVNNKLEVGDKLELPLYCANYASSAGMMYPLWAESTVAEKLIDASGNQYEPFSDEEYEIVGLYEVYAGMDGYTGYEAGRNEVIIPAASVQESDENNILDYGPMKGYNTSFEIENGTIDEFWEVWNRQGIDELEITFYDKGYEALEQSFQNTRKMSVILLGAGIGTVILILLFFCHMFITRQKLRTAIERSLGMSQAKCRASLMGGVLLITVVGAAAGSAAGALLTGTVIKGLERGTDYSAMYSAGKAVIEKVVSSPDVLSGVMVNAVIPAIAAGAVLMTAILISGLMIHRNLREEPMEQLARMKNEN